MRRAVLVACGLLGSADDVASATCDADFPEQCVPPDNELPVEDSIHEATEDAEQSVARKIKKSRTTTTAMPPPKRASGSENPFSSPSLQSVWSSIPAPPSGVDLLGQEVAALEAAVAQKQAKVAVLKELKLAIMGEGVHDQRRLTSRVPRVEYVISSSDMHATSSAADFMQTVAVVEPSDEERTAFVRLLGLKNFRVGAPPTPAHALLPLALLVLVSDRGNATIFTPSGSRLKEFSLGHSAPIERVTTTSSQEDHIILSQDADGIMRTHSVILKPAKPAKPSKEARRSATEAIPSKYLAVTPNVSVFFERQMRLPKKGGSVRAVTDVAISKQRGLYYLTAADEGGGVTVYFRNGTMKGRAIATDDEGGIQGLFPVPDALLYHSAHGVGFVSAESLDVKSPVCAEISSPVVSATVDASATHRVNVGLQGGEVVVFNLKDRSSCKFEQRLPKLSGSPLHLEPFKGYMVALEQGVPHPVFYALNISGPPKSSSPPTISLAFERRLRNVTQFAALRRSTPGAESDFFAFLRTDGSVEVVELLWTVYLVPDVDETISYKWPAVAAIVCVVLGIQWLRSRRASGGSSRNPEEDLDAVDWKKLAEETRARAQARKQQHEDDPY